MANLSISDRQALHKAYMEKSSSDRVEIPINKVELQLAIDAIDDWIEANQSGFNLAIPLPARTALTAKEKVLLMTEVAKRRYEVS